MDEIKQKLDIINKKLDAISTKNKSSKVLKTIPHDYKLLFLGFILSTIAGGFISYVYQKQMYDYQKSNIDYENKQKEINSVYKNVTEIITERNISGNRLIEAIEANRTTTEIADKKDKYYTAIDKWSVNDAYNRSFLKCYFKDSTYLEYIKISETFVNEIHPCVKKILINNQDSISIINFKKLYDIQKLNSSNFITKANETVFKKD